MLDINSLHLGDYSFTVKCTDPWIIVLHNFLTDSEIAYLLDVAKNRYQRSVVVGKDLSHEINDKRTSSSCMFTKSENAVLSSIVQLVKYDTAEQYAPHFDYFDGATDYSKNEILLRGQRCLTILAYLSEPLSGGSTFFPRLNMHIEPKKGTAVLWFNTKKDGVQDPRTEHGGMPVHKGTKVAMNIWVRDKPYV